MTDVVVPAGAGDVPAGEEVGAAQPTWTTRVHVDGADLAAVAAEWDDLQARCPSATPFQTHAWLSSWWREYGTAGRLRLVLVRCDGRLVAAAPLHLVRRGPVRVLAPVGGDRTDYHDVLVDPAVPTAGTRLAGALAALPGWDVLDLTDVRAGAAAHLLAASWPGRRWRTGGAMCLEIPAGSVAGFVDRLPSAHARQAVRRKIRKIEASGIEREVVGPGDVPGAVRDLLHLHERQWRNRGVTAEHLRPRFGRHLVSALTAMVERGQAEVARFHLDGEVVVVDLALIGRDAVCTYLAGYCPGLRQRVDVATLMLHRVLALAERTGRTRISLLRGDEPYKATWRPEPARNDRLLLARRRVAPVASAYAGAVLARRAAADVLRERAPWLRSVRVRVRSAVGRPRSRP